MPREDRSPIFADSMRYLEKRNRGQTKTFVVIVTILVSLFLVVAIAIPMSSGPVSEPSLKAAAPNFNESSNASAYFRPPAFYEIDGNEVHQLKPHYVSPPSFIEINGSDIKVHNLSSRSYSYNREEENGDDLWSRLHRLAKIKNSDRKHDDGDESKENDYNGRPWRRRKNFDDSDHVWRKKESNGEDGYWRRNKINDDNDEDDRAYWNKVRKEDDNGYDGRRNQNDDGDDDDGDDDDTIEYWRKNSKQDKKSGYWKRNNRRNEANKDDDDEGGGDERRERKDYDEKKKREWNWQNELNEKDRNDDTKELIDKYELFIQKFLNETRAERSTPDENLEKKKNKDIKHYENENLDEDELAEKRQERKAFKKKFKFLKIRAKSIKEQFRNDEQKIYYAYEDWQEETVRQVALIVGQYERYDEIDQKIYRKWLADLKVWMNNLHRTMKEANYSRRFTNEYRQKGKNFVDDLERWKEKWDEKKKNSKKLLVELADDLKKWWNKTADSDTKTKTFNDLIEDIQNYIGVRIGDRKIEKKYNEKDDEWYWTDSEKEKEDEDNGDKEKKREDEKLDIFENFIRRFFNRTSDERYDPDEEIQKKKNIAKKNYEDEYLDEDEVEEKRRERVFYKKKFKALRIRGKAVEQRLKDDEKKIYQTYQNWEDNVVRQIAFIVAQYETYDKNDQKIYKQWLSDFKVWMDDLHENLGNANFTRRFTEEYRQKNKNFVDDFEQSKAKWDKRKETSKPSLKKLADDLKKWWKNKNNTAVKNEVFGLVIKDFQDYLKIRKEKKIESQNDDKDNLQAPKKQKKVDQKKDDDEDEFENDSIKRYYSNGKRKNDDLNSKVEAWKKELDDFVEQKLEEWKKDHTTATMKPKKTTTETTDEELDEGDYSENYWDIPPRVRPRKSQTTKTYDNEKENFADKTQTPRIAPRYEWNENPRTPNENKNEPTQKLSEIVTRPRRDLPVGLITKPSVQKIIKKSTPKTTENPTAKTTPSTTKETVFPPSQCPAMPLDRTYKAPLASYADQKLYEVARIQSLGIPLPVPSVNVRCVNIYVKVKKSGLQYIPDDAVFYNNWECGSNKNLWNNVSMIATQSTADWVEKFNNYNITSDINLSFLFSDAYWVLAFECYTDITYPDVAYNIRLFSKGQPRALDAKGTQMMKEAEDAGLNPGGFTMVQVLHTDCDYEGWTF